MDSAASPLYSFGAYRLDPQERLLLRDGQPVPLSPKAFDMLLVLVRHSGRVVEKELLLKEVWPDTFVEEGNLTVHMSALRKALGDGGESNALIETVPRRGYRFRMPVDQSPAAQPSLVMERRVETRIVREEIEEPTPGSARIWRAVAIGVTVLLIAVAAATWQGLFKASAPAGLRVAPFASYPGRVSSPAFAPDGERLAFSWSGPVGGNFDIYVKVIGNDPPLRLTSHTAADGYPAWSPDGRQIAFLRIDGDRAACGVYMVGALGGGERKITDLPFGRYFGLDWSPDGRWLVFAEKTDPREPYNSNRSLALFSLLLETGEKRQITFPKDPERDSRFAISFDGKTLALLRHDNAGTTIMTVPLAGGEPSILHREPNWIGNVAWTAGDTALVYSSARDGGRKLFRIPADGGTPEPLPMAEANAYSPAIAPRGNRMAYVRETQDDDLWAIDVEPSGEVSKPVALPSSGRSEIAPEFSPDGRKLAFFSEGSGRQELWWSEADGTNASALTDFHASTTFAPSWSPDGKELVFASLHGPRGGDGGVFVIEVATRQLRKLSDDAYALPTWSRDGQWIYLAKNPLFTTSGIWKIPARGGPGVQVSETGGLIAQESPDGQTLFFMKHSGGIWKVPAAGGAETEVIADTIFRGGWRPTKSGIYLRSMRGLEFYQFAGGHRRLLAPVYDENAFSGGLSVSPDGRRIVYSQTAHLAVDIMLVENFR